MYSGEKRIAEPTGFGAIEQIIGGGTNMSKQVFIISTSPRKGGNSDALAGKFAQGAREMGHQVEKVCLYDKTIGFCKGCLACQAKRDGHCVTRDDADEIVQRMAAAEVVVFSTPIYFYEMCGQMKTLLDRSNPLFPVDYAFRDIYLLASAAEDEKTAIDGAISGLNGWISCFEKTRLAGTVLGKGATAPADIQGNPAMEAAYAMGKNI